MSSDVSVRGGWGAIGIELIFADDLQHAGYAIPGGVFDDFLVDLNIWTGSPTADLAKSLSMA
jgi:hypothetical protein